MRILSNKMIGCKSKYGFGKCIVNMGAQETLGGVICCDLAEECDYNEELILKMCEFAEEEEQTGQLGFV